MKNEENLNKEELEETEVIEQETEDEAMNEIEESDDINDEKEDKKDTVPLSKFLELKKQLKEKNNTLSKYEEKELDNSMIRRKNEIIKKWKDKGYDDDFAESMADDIVSVMQETVTNKKYSKLEEQIAEDLEDLSNSDLFFSDAKAYKKDIVKYIKQMKSKDIDIAIEEAYMHVRGVKNRLKEVQTDLEQRNLYGKTQKSKKEVSNSSSVKQSNQYKLDEHDKKALTELKKMQPNSNWSEEKFYKLMKK